MEKLKAYFYDRFKNGNFEEVTRYLKNVNTREYVIQELAENQAEAYKLNQDYEKDFTIIYKIFKNSNDAKKELEQLQKENQELIKKNQKLKYKYEEAQRKTDQIKQKGLLKTLAGCLVAGRVAEKGIKKYKI